MKRPTYYGPKRAVWHVLYTRPDGSTGSAGSHTADMASTNHNYYLSLGYTVRVERTELCAVPGCDGWYGNIARVTLPARERACPNHASPDVVFE